MKDSRLEFDFSIGLCACGCADAVELAACAGKAAPGGGSFALPGGGNFALRLALG
jgi:hypothetical protein